MERVGCYWREAVANKAGGSAQKEGRMEEEEEVKTDLLGQIIEPGCLVAIGRSGQGSRQMEVRIVSSIAINKRGAGRVYFFGNKIRWNRKKSEYEKSFSDRCTWSDFTRGKIQEHIVIIRNPMFFLSNPSIARQLAVADDAMDAGFLPSSYSLGRPKSEWEVEEQWLL